MGKLSFLIPSIVSRLGLDVVSHVADSPFKISASALDYGHFITQGMIGFTVVNTLTSQGLSQLQLVLMVSSAGTIELMTSCHYWPAAQTTQFRIQRLGSSSVGH